MFFGGSKLSRMLYQDCHQWKVQAGYDCLLVKEKLWFGCGFKFNISMSIFISYKKKFDFHRNLFRSQR